MRSAAVAAAATATLALAPSALGHGSVRPTLAEPGATTEFTFEVLNARGTAMVGFRLELPPGSAIVDVPPKPGWPATQGSAAVEWRGSAAPRGSESFAVDVRLPRREGTVSFEGRELFADGTGPAFRLDVVVAGAASSGDDDGLGTTAVVLTVAGGLLVVALAVAARRLRS